MKEEEGSSNGEQKITTVVEYIEEQNQLEKEARELMPYEPNECTYAKGELRQPVFACLTCSRDNNNTPIGVCYSCSIRCHSSHELVELFSKRNFVCDCGTTRMSQTKSGGCKVRSQIEHSSDFRPRTGSISHSRTNSLTWIGPLDIPAEDIPGTNNYNQNYKGLFCSCAKPYNPLEETGNMIQCFFGFECGEDWYHDACIAGYQKGSIIRPLEEEDGNLLDKLPEPADEAANDVSVVSIDTPGDSSVSLVPHFPSLDDFDVFICWKCSSIFKDVFEEFEKDKEIVVSTLAHLDNVNSVEEWESLNNEEDQPSRKKVKSETGSTSLKKPKSYFFNFGFKDKLKDLKETTGNDKVKSFLNNYPFLYESDPVYEPPADDDGSSTLELGTEALLNLPREQAVEGLQAFNQIRSKLKDFLKPFADEGKIVTEEEVRSFFSKMKKDDS